ncbi:hypothetical protein HanIR_Chr11g0544191 [Helianthus annuus]|nr:hypothetical protein HanIR_Chr11g0544191 [Helianthus annuus]
MSCTSPWDWSMDPRPGEDQTSAVVWMRNVMPPRSISESQWALVTNQNQSIQNLLINESEAGSNNRPPKLNHMNDYPSWKNHFHTYVLGQNTELWMCFTTPYNTALEEAGSNAATLENMLEGDKKAYDMEKKTFSILTQALHKDIYHQFAYCTSTKNLWDILVTRGEGNAATRKVQHDLSRKEFEGFLFMENETLTEMTTRYYHLISKMYSYKVNASEQEMVMRFAEALPPKWNQFIELLKQTGVLNESSIYEFVQKIENKDKEEIRKAKRIPVSSTSSFPFPQSAPPPVFDPSAYLPLAHVTAQAHALSKPQLDPSAWLPKPQPQPQVSTTQPQFDPSAYFPKPTVDCGPAIQFGNGDQTRTAFYAEIVKNINDGETSGNDDSSGYSGSTDEDGSGVSDYSSESDVKEGMDSEAVCRMMPRR